MAIYNSASGHYGIKAKMGRVNALRKLAASGVITFHRYVRGETPEYQITNVEDEPRSPTGAEVPVYLLGAHDLLLALRQQMPEIIDTAFANPSVVDRESLAEAILEQLDSRYDVDPGQATARFPQERHKPELPAAS